MTEKLFVTVICIVEINSISYQISEVAQDMNLIYSLSELLYSSLLHNYCPLCEEDKAIMQNIPLIKDIKW